RSAFAGNLRMDRAAELLPPPRTRTGHQRITQGNRAATWPDVLSLERGRGLPRATGLAPGRRDGDEVGAAFLGHAELRAAQRGAPRLRGVLARLAVLECRTGLGRGRTPGSGTALA